MNKLLIFTLFCSVLLIQPNDVYAKGGFSSGGSRGGFSSSRSYSRPSVSSRSSVSSRPSYQSRITTTRSSYTYGSPMHYSGFGMGYGYNNGLMQGLLIGHLLHPTGTVPYAGGGYGGNALLYPDGRVVNKDGYQVGTYNDGQFNSVEGGMVAKQVPVEAPPVAVTTWTGWEIFGFCVALFIAASLFTLIIL